MRVAGADLSLASTGLALVDGGVFQGWANPKSKGSKGDGYPEFCERINLMSDTTLAYLGRWHRNDSLDLLVIESPSHGSKFGNPHERAGLWWDVYRWAWREEIPIATVAPTTRAKYITGDGRANKTAVLDAARRLWEHGGYTIPHDDIADGSGLASMGSRWLGKPCEELPDKNLEAMEGAKWPTT